MSTPELQMWKLMANGWINFCWQKIDEIVDDPQNGAKNQERLEIILTYMELLNQNRQSGDLDKAQEQNYQELLDWVKVHGPSTDLSKLK